MCKKTITCASNQKAFLNKQYKISGTKCRNNPLPPLFLRARIQAASLCIHCFVVLFWNQYRKLCATNKVKIHLYKLYDFGKKSENLIFCKNDWCFCIYGLLWLFYHCWVLIDLNFVYMFFYPFRANRNYLNRYWNESLKRSIRWIKIYKKRFTVLTSDF